MSDDHIQYEKRGSIGFVKFNRPDKRNAFTIEMFRWATTRWTHGTSSGAFAESP
ncbi:MAG: enoyl-CoA hydratase/isomerase family protein [Deltaproteobacteria bacterium]|nr:enoyl-CoA hydratase/isomerase family protein [Deltaproteobacteria bacterium]MBW2189524.1 enoyl-CoA hydratase/isomerase family protein [Deltaproteobacteria bacterium]MBW2222903.1 enoyl-CoA hydratase/isomerase family protein [Deltaproteobacteria bacterium]MBW2402797.1 enoyl-CoA hydratase/isomerase family protein [Deltaproteobacteria bacterium]MBW2547018.1 enoyl-CoA hydratase/isomerase family protein [Deltaproteobacteria bacterium]